MAEGGEPAAQMVCGLNMAQILRWIYICRDVLTNIRLVVFSFSGYFLDEWVPNGV